MVLPQENPRRFSPPPGASRPLPGHALQGMDQTAALLALLFAGALVRGYLSLRLRSVHQFHDAVSIWSAWISRATVFSSFKFFPLGAVWCWRVAVFAET